MTDAQATALADRPPGNASPDTPASLIPGAPVWMTMAETAVYLKKPYNTLSQHWRKWGLISYKIGRERQFRQDEVDAWIREQREGQSQLDRPAQPRRHVRAHLSLNNS